MPASPVVLVKEAHNNKSQDVSLASDLAANETITGATIGAIAPATVPALTLLPVTFTASSIKLTMQGGAIGTTYSVRVSITTSLARTLSFVTGVLVISDMSVPYSSRNPTAFQSLVGEIQVGDAAVSKMFFTLPTNTDFSKATVTWSLLDNAGSTYATGNAYDYSVVNNSFNVVLGATAIINVPSDVPPTLASQRYQLRWELVGVDAKPVYAFENLKVLPLTTAPQGVPDIVELVGDVAELTIVLPRIYDYVGIEIFDKNNVVLGFTAAQSAKQVDSGWFFQYKLNTGSLRPQLDAYTVTWKYYDVNDAQNTITGNTGLTYRETGRMFVLTPSMLNAIDAARSMINTATTTLAGFDVTLFSVPRIVSFLQRGRDMFNGAGGLITFFDMTNASGAIREFWLRYSEIAILRSQYLAEGEKAFDFQGQAISLNVDRTQYYQGMADQLQQQLDTDIKTFKAGLLKKGLDGGDGDLNNARGARSMGKVGISMTPITNLPYRYRGAPGFRR